MMMDIGATEVPKDADSAACPGPRLTTRALFHARLKNVAGAAPRNTAAAPSLASSVFGDLSGLSDSVHSSVSVLSNAWGLF